MKFSLFRTVLFDWGNTLMHDNPFQATSMMSWPQVTIVDGADTLLSALHARGLVLALATGALNSDESEIRAALALVQLDHYLKKIYCHSNTGFYKPSAAFYQHILNDLHTNPSETLMIGDSLENDVLAANRLGINAIWFNPINNINKNGPLFATVHSLSKLLALFQSAN